MREYLNLVRKMVVKVASIVDALKTLEKEIKRPVFGRGDSPSYHNYLVTLSSNTPGYSTLSKTCVTGKEINDIRKSHRTNRGTPVFSGITPGGTKLLSRHSIIISRENLSQENVMALVFSPAKKERKSFITPVSIDVEQLAAKLGSYEKVINTIIITRDSLDRRSQIDRKALSSQREVMGNSSISDIDNLIKNPNITKAEQEYFKELANKRVKITKHGKEIVIHDFEYLHLCAYSLAPIDFNPQVSENLVVGHKDTNTNMIFWAERIAEVLAKLDKTVKLDIKAKCFKDTHIAYAIEYKITVMGQSYVVNFSPIAPKPKARRSDALLHLRNMVHELDNVIAGKNILGKRKIEPTKHHDMQLRPRKNQAYGSVR